jgi:hypothetical protein
MKILFTIGLFFINLFVIAQVDSIGIKDALQKLENALIQKDETVLRSLLHNNVSYGHSNGWVQNKADVLNDFKSGKLQYDKITSTAVSILDMGKNRATVKMNTEAEGKLNGNAFNIKMHVLQVWLKTKKGWQLYSRQSAKL